MGLWGPVLERVGPGGPLTRRYAATSPPEGEVRKWRRRCYTSPSGGEVGRRPGEGAFRIVVAFAAQPGVAGQSVEPQARMLAMRLRSWSMPTAPGMISSPMM